MSSKYIVYVVAPSYPASGYYLEARKLSRKEARGEEDFRDSLSPDLLDLCGKPWIEVEADHIEEAKAAGLAKIMRQCKCKE